MPVAMLLGLVAMAKQRHVLSSAQLLEQAQREFLAVVLDAPIALIDAAALRELLAIAAAEFAPRDRARPEIVQQRLARREIRHPHIVPARRQAASAETRRQDAQAVLASLNRRFDGLGLDHGCSGYG